MSQTQSRIPDPVHAACVLQHAPRPAGHRGSDQRTTDFLRTSPHRTARRLCVKRAAERGSVEKEGVDASEEATRQTAWALRL
eukprot:2784472-Pleurochrysis_carterae.AAC.1